MSVALDLPAPHFVPMRVRSVTPKPGYVFDGQSVMPVRPAGNVIPLRDGLVNILTGAGTRVDRAAHAHWAARYFTVDQIENAYRTSWLHRKIVDIPAEDMTRAGRDWDADEGDIEKIEAEEKRLGVWVKLREAIRLGRLGGGAIVLGVGSQPSQPLPGTIGKGTLSYISVFSRYQLTLGDMVTDPADPLFGEPAYFRLSSGASGANGGQIDIHPSRVIPFKGLPVPALQTISWQDRYWGDSVVQAVNEAVEHASMAAAGFASLIDEAKIDVYKIAGLIEAAAGGKDQAIIDRLQAMNTGKSIHRAIAIDAEDEWEQRQMTWAGMRDLIITYDGRVAGAADIPATRLFGKSPDGMNATGDGDMDNYRQSIGAKQEMDLRPPLERLDAVLLPSAGVSQGSGNKSLTFAFSPLQVLSEKEQAEIENKEADTVSKIVNTGLIPESAMAKATANRMIESQRWPGLQDAIDEAEAQGEPLGGAPGENEPDPNSLQATEEEVIETSAGGGTIPNRTRPVRRAAVGSRRAANDAEPRTLYVSRKLLNGAEFLKWAKSQGFESTLEADDLHVTVAFSRQKVDWMKMGQSWGNDDGKLTIPAGGARIVEPLGDKGAIVLLFNSSELSWRHEDMKRNGASFDYDAYQPHVTITYSGSDIDLSKVEPYRGKLEFGPEIFEEVTEDWEVGRG